MRRSFLLLLLPASLAACSSSAATKRATPTPMRNSVAIIETAPPSSPPPIKRSKYKTKSRSKSKLKALPTIKPYVNVITPTPFPASAYTAILHGRVTNAKTHSPIAGALITVGLLPKHMTRTNALGKYRITFPAGPAVTVQVSAKGFAGALAIGHLRNRQKLKLNFRLPPIVPNKPIAPPPPTSFGSP